MAQSRLRQWDYALVRFRRSYFPESQQLAPKFRFDLDLEGEWMHPHRLRGFHAYLVKVAMTWRLELSLEDKGL